LELSRAFGRFEYCAFDNNEATGSENAGAVYIQNTQTFGVTTFFECTFQNNRVKNGDDVIHSTGALYSEKADIDIIGCRFQSIAPSSYPFPHSYGHLDNEGSLPEGSGKLDLAAYHSETEITLESKDEHHLYFLSSFF